MRPELRRIVAVEAHRRRTGRLPRVIHALGTGESFEIADAPDGFVDLATGIAVKSEPARIVLPATGAAIAFALEGDVGFAGYDPESRERFTGRAGGGASVTVYEPRGEWFQYAMLEWEGAAWSPHPGPPP
jgi:hypothetical protein